jgi:hypothetical protein
VKYYVYKHICPKTKEVVYVGYGSYGRAWNCGGGKTPLRSQEHHEWMVGLLCEGFTPDQWIEIVKRNLSREEARADELLNIHEIKPRFNKSIRYTGLKFTPDKYFEAKKLREEGKTFNEIAEIIGLSAMTIHRGLSGKSISLEVAIAEK